VELGEPVLCDRRLFIPKRRIGLQDHIVETGIAVAAIDGGNYYWHARRSESTGDDDISPDTPPRFEAG